MAFLHIVASAGPAAAAGAGILLVVSYIIIIFGVVFRLKSVLPVRPHLRLRCTYNVFLGCLENSMSEEC